MFDFVIFRLFAAINGCYWIKRLTIFVVIAVLTHVGESYVVVILEFAA